MPMEEFIRDVAIPGLLKEPWSRSTERGAEGNMADDTCVNGSLGNFTSALIFLYVVTVSILVRFERSGTICSRSCMAVPTGSSSTTTQPCMLIEQSTSQQRRALLKYRLITHFYSYLYFADPRVDRRYKRVQIV